MKPTISSLLYNIANKTFAAIYIIALIVLGCTLYYLIKAEIKDIRSKNVRNHHTENWADCNCKE